MAEEFEYIPRPDVPRAADLQIAFCDDPECGPHLLAYDANDQPMCEMVISLEVLPGVIEQLQNCLAMKQRQAKGDKLDG